MGAPFYVIIGLVGPVLRPACPRRPFKQAGANCLEIGDLEILLVFVLWIVLNLALDGFLRGDELL
jgi:hypothetical protein